MSTRTTHRQGLTNYYVCIVCLSMLVTAAVGVLALRKRKRIRGAPHEPSVRAVRDRRHGSARAPDAPRGRS